MLIERESSHGVMESGGSYNQRAFVPAGGGSLALPFLEEAVQEITLDQSDQPIVIADYGSSQGKNSFVPMRVAIKVLRKRVGLDRPISVVHIDQAANDFNTLFDVLRVFREYCLWLQAREQFQESSSHGVRADCQISKGSVFLKRLVADDFVGSR